MFAIHWNHEGVRGTPRVKESLEEAVSVMRRFATLGFENVRIAECDERGRVLRFIPVNELPLISAGRPIEVLNNC